MGQALSHGKELIPSPRWTRRYGPDGVHLFERVSGLNILMDEIRVPEALWSRSPRQVSIALLNACDLRCAHCHAPKVAAMLREDQIQTWVLELDKHGCHGIGFGGGEPMLAPSFAGLCRFTAECTGMAVTATTHGHHLTDQMAGELRGSVHFLRLSMDGVGTTYQRSRGRPFASFVEHLKTASTIAPFGINYLVNSLTLPEITEALDIADEAGAAEFLLLPEQPSASGPGIDPDTLYELREFAADYSGRCRLSISETASAGFPTCSPFIHGLGLRAYAHIDAQGNLKRSSFHKRGVKIGEGGVLSAIERLSRTQESTS